MALQGNYLGMDLTVDDLDVENLAYFGYCAEHSFHLQECTGVQAGPLPADHRLSRGA